MLALSVSTIILEVVLAFLIGYLLLLTIGAIFSKRSTTIIYPPKNRFAILIPAHNEERLLPELLSNLKNQTYPKNMVQVFVVADNCTDGTSDIARQSGASVFERFDETLPGKGYALNWLLDNIITSSQISAEKVNQATEAERSIQDFQIPYDAFVIFDSDTVVTPGFLEVMDARLQRGENAIQGYYAVRDPGRSWEVSIRYAALAVLHYLRPLGRGLFGGSAGLKGNGMCFRSNLYLKNRWSGSVTEDIEYHMALILAGQRVTFAPDAFLEAEMPGSLKSSTTQNVRWESGRLQAEKKYIPLLLSHIKGNNAFLLIDAIMEHIIPPTAVLGMALGACLLLAGLNGWLSGSWILFWIALVLLASLVCYIYCGLRMVKAPQKVWVSLIYAPFYAAWKVILLVGILLGIRKQGWVRTQR